MESGTEHCRITWVPFPSLRSAGDDKFGLEQMIAIEPAISLKGIA
jgi:hypothetical protein